MREKRFSNLLTALLVSLTLGGGLSHAATLYSDSVSILSTSPTQLGRLSRNGIIADWSFQEPFPGTINPTVSYHYAAITVQVPNYLSYLQISIDSENGNIFASAYDTSYNPDPTAANRGLDVNYMGDEGGSGNIFGNPAFFQVVDLTAFNSPTGFGNVVVVLNETTFNAGLNSPVGLLVEGFSGTDFSEAPEPASFGLIGAGILALAAGRRRRSRARMSTRVSE